MGLEREKRPVVVRPTASSHQSTKPQRRKSFWGGAIASAEQSDHEHGIERAEPEGLHEQPARGIDLSRVSAATRPGIAVRPKLRINRPGDRYEEEADRIAEQVARPPAVRSDDAGPEKSAGETLVARSPAMGVSPISGADAGGTAAPDTIGDALASHGAQIAPEIRQRMEEHIGRPFDDVRIHADGTAAASADEIGARAYTVGRDIVFAEGEYRPGTAEGDRLLAHELVHVAQQVAIPGAGATGGLVQRDSGPRKAKQGDVPGERSAAYLDGEEWQIRIDADGNQHKELLLLLKQVEAPEGYSKSTYLGLQLTIQHIGYTETQGVIFPVRRRQGWDRFHEIVKQMTDGKVDTIITLMNEGRPELLLAPPTKQGKNVAYTFRLANPKGEEIGTKETVNDFHVTLSLRDVRRKRDDVFGTGTPQSNFGISTLDVTLGAYKDRFRLMSRPTGEGTLLFGIIPYEESVPIDPNDTKSTEGADKEQDASTDKPMPQVVEFVNRGRGIYLSFPKKPYEGGTSTDGSELVSSKGIAVVANDGVSLSLDLDGDGAADVTLYDSMELRGDINPIQPTADKLDRTHIIRLTGSAVGGEKTVRFERTYQSTMPDTATDSVADKYANAYTGAAKTLTAQQQEGTTGDQLAQIDSYERSVRRDALQSKLITQRTYDAWNALDQDLTQIRLKVSDPGNQSTSSDPTKDGRTVDQALVSRAATEAKEFYEALEAETAHEPLEPQAAGLGGMRNKYTDATTLTTGGYPFGWSTTTVSGAGPELEETIRSDAAGHWEDAFRKYEMLASGLDLWISKKRMDQHDKVGYDERKQIEQEKMVALRHRDLAELASEAGAEPKRILATYFPDPDLDYETSEKVNHAREIPLALYYWGTEDTWYIEDLTSPGRRYHHTVDRLEGETVPGGRLVREMNDSYHYPKGIIQYSIPDGVSGAVAMEDHVTWRDFVEWLQIAAIGLAVVGATLSGLEFTVPALWAMGASIVAQTASATIDLVGKSQTGELTATNALIDIGMIISGIAGMAELATGRIVAEGLNAAASGAPLEGAAAEYAVLMQRIYLPAKAARIGADIFTLGTVTLEVAQQLDQIESGPGSQSEKNRAKLILLTNVAMNGGLLALSIKGDLPAFGANRELRLYFPGRNPVTHAPEGIPTAVLSGMEPPTNLRFSQTWISEKTSDNIPHDELARRIKEGWNGEPVDVVEWGPGDMTSLDNRRVDASIAGNTEKIPVNYHQPSEAFPKERAEYMKLKSGKEIFLVNGEYVLGRPAGYTGAPVYKAGDAPKTWGEAIMFRAANQGEFLRGPNMGQPFPLKGSYERPYIGQPPKKKK